MSFPSDYKRPGPRPVKLGRSKPKKRAAKTKTPTNPPFVTTARTPSGAYVLVPEEPKPEPLHIDVSEASGAHDEEIRKTLRAFRADETDVRALGALVLVLWRSNLLCTYKQRRCQVSFRLRGLDSRGRSRRGMTHPWPTKKYERDKGLWWTVGGPWKDSDGRAWIQPCSNEGQTWWSRDLCLPFNSIHELIDYVCERATEWRAEERTR